RFRQRARYVSQPAGLGKRHSFGSQDRDTHSKRDWHKKPSTDYADISKNIRNLWMALIEFSFASRRETRRWTSSSPVARARLPFARLATADSAHAASPRCD